MIAPSESRLDVAQLMWEGTLALTFRDTEVPKRHCSVHVVGSGPKFQFQS